MSALATVLTSLFYAATLLALLFFLHKVFWLIQYKKLQRGLVDEAERRLERDHQAVVGEWEIFTREAWEDALGGDGNVGDAADYLRQTEEGFTRLRDDLRSSRRSIEDLLGKALSQKASAPAGTQAVLSVRRLRAAEGGPSRVEMKLDFPAVTAPRPPDRSLYELKARSRYGLVRRALVFFSGAADVVYSSQHVALMSQNVHVPASVLVRRLSLVFLILSFVLVDIVFGVKRWLGGVYGEWLHPPPVAAHAGRAAQVLAAAPAPDFFSASLPSVLAFGTWMAAYGAIYLAVYFLIRRRYQVSVRRLRQMAEGEAETMHAIRAHHVAELVRWGRAYGQSLDTAVNIAVRHVETLIDHHTHRLRRRVASPALLGEAKAIADSLFLRLPESRGDLVDAATQQKHSLRHHIWPRPEEMEYQVRFAQYRAAWQGLEVALGELRRERPDPAQAHDLWRAAMTCATVFAPLVPEGAEGTLKQAYAQMVAECVSDTERDLASLDKRLVELGRTLGDQLESARALIESRVELANQSVAGEVAAMSAEIIRVREQARLEAMAFEI
jgi:hypothetical protein